MIKTKEQSTIKILLKFFRDILTWDPWSNRSWSQEGEDMILRRIFENKNKGFYVDVGAHHPKRFSNTYYFYRRGWRGINIDAMPGSMKLFNKWRKRDINLELGIANQEVTLDYYIFNEPALNSFSATLSEERERAASPYHIKRIIKVSAKPLRNILDCHPQSCKIDFLNVDAEGMDLDVLRSNDWQRHRPSFVLVEILNRNLHELDNNQITKFMREQKYNIYAKQVNTVFFKDSQN